MTTDTTVEEKLFRDTTVDFITSETPISHLRELNERDEAFKRDWWRRGAELGWTALLVPEERGGGSVSGRGVLDLVDVATEQGKSAVAGPLHAVSTVLTALAEAPDGPDHQDLIDDLVSGESVATWAVYEPGRAWAPERPELTAASAEGGFLLNGVKDRVDTAPQADVFLVTATGESGPTQFVVHRGTPGVKVERADTVDAAKQYGTLHLDGVRVGAGAVVGTPASTPTLIARQAQIAGLLQVAESVGAVGHVFDFTVQWGFDRYSFGRPLASYQALKHRYADMMLWLEASRSTLAGAAQAVQDHAENAGFLVSVAQSYVGQRSVEIIQDCVQLHGGIGVTWEHDLHLYLRRATLNRQLIGTPGEHRRAITTELGL